MKVLVGKRTYRMSRNEYKKLLEETSTLVKRGVYAIEKRDYAELRNDKCTSMTQLKALVRQFKQAGYKVYYNR